MANGCSSPNKRWPSSYYCNMYLINPRSCWGLPNAPLHLWYWRPGCFGERCVQKLRGSVTISVIAAGFQPSWTALGRAGERLQLCDFPGVGDGEGDNSGQLLSIPGAAQTCSRPTNSWWSYSLDELAAATPDAALPEILALRKHSVGTGTDWFLPILIWPCLKRASLEWQSQFLPCLIFFFHVSTQGKPESYLSSLIGRQLACGNLQCAFVLQQVFWHSRVLAFDPLILWSFADFSMITAASSSLPKLCQPKIAGDEGHGSILSYLKDEGWASELTAGAGGDNFSHSSSLDTDRRCLTMSYNLLHSIFAPYYIYI